MSWTSALHNQTPNYTTGNLGYALNYLPQSQTLAYNAQNILTSSGANL